MRKNMKWARKILPCVFGLTCGFYGITLDHLSFWVLILIFCVYGEACAVSSEYTR